MQTHGGSSAEAAILGNQRTFINRLRVDWNKNGKFDHALSDLSGFSDDVSVDRALTGSAPPEILLIEGSSSAQLRFTISGDYKGMSFPSVFSRYNRASPFYGKAIVSSEVTWSILVETSTGIVEYPQFRGIIRTVTPNRKDNTVTITALDYVEELRKPVILPSWAISEEHVNYGEIDSQLCRSHWVIDSCLRLCNTSPSNTRPRYKEEQGLPADGAEGVQFFLSGNGSYLPTVWLVDNLNASTFPAAGKAMYQQTNQVNPKSPTGTPRPWGFAGLGTPVQQRYGTPGDQGIIRYWVTDRDGINPWSAHYLGFTLNTNGTNADAYKTVSQFSVLEIAIGYRLYLYIDISAGKVRTRIHNQFNDVHTSGPWYNIPTDKENVYITAWWDLSERTGTRSSLRVGDTYTAVTTHFSGPPPRNSNIEQRYDQIGGRVTLGQALSVADIFYSSRNYYGSTLNEGEAVAVPKRAAVLDQGLNRFSHMPSGGKARDAWDIIKEVASAEFGSVFWDETGIFRFWNYQRMLQKQNTVVRHFTLDHVSGFQMTDSTDSIRNVYTVTTTRRRSLTGINRVFDAQDVNQFYVPARTTKFFNLYVADIVSPLTFLMAKHDTMPDGPVGVPEWTDLVNHGYCVQYKFPIGWYEDPTRAGVDIYVYFNTLGHLTVRIWNGWYEDIRLAAGGTSADGSFDNSRAAFRIGGSKIVSSDSLSFMTRNPASITKYGARNLPLQGDWYQDTSNSAQMMSVLMPRTAEPIPATDAVQIAGDPRLQMGDTIAVTDPDGFGTGIKLQILGISRSLKRSSGLTDRLSVEMLPPDAVAAPPAAPDIPDNPLPPAAEPNDPSGGYVYNLCPNPALSIDPDGWYGPTGSVRQDAIPELPRSTGFDVPRAGNIILPKARITGGKSYEFSVAVRALTNPVSGNAYLHWYTDGGYLSSSPATPWLAPAGTVARVSTGLRTAPQNATQALLELRGTSGACQVTAAFYIRGGGVDYFDGDSPDSVWMGTAGRSVSRHKVSAGTPQDPGTTPNPDPQPDNPTDSAAYILDWGAAIPGSDTFDYTGAVNSAKWSIEGTGGIVGGNECIVGRTNGRRCKANVTLSGTYARITGEADGDTSALVSTVTRVTGRWEVRARFTTPSSGGVKYTPVIELYPASGVTPDDGHYTFVQAAIGDNKVNAFIRYPESELNQQVYTSSTFDPTQFHNYAIEWTNQHIKGYIDGVEFFSMNDPAGLTQSVMQLRIGLDNPTGGVMEPATMDVAWARFYPAPVVSAATGFGHGSFGHQKFGH